jgi:hypothetical protein
VTSQQVKFLIEKITARFELHSSKTEFDACAARLAEHTPVTTQQLDDLSSATEWH